MSNRRATKHVVHGNGEGNYTGEKLKIE